MTKQKTKRKKEVISDRLIEGLIAGVTAGLIVALSNLYFSENPFLIMIFSFLGLIIVLTVWIFLDWFVRRRK